MRYKIRNLISSNLLRCSFISILSLLALIYFTSFSLKNLTANGQIFTLKELVNNYSLITKENNFFYLCVSVVYPSLITIIIFRFFYLNSEKALEICLEKSREYIFKSNLIASLILIITPYLIAFFATLFVVDSNIIPLKLVVFFFLKSIIFELYIFSIALFVTVTVKTVVIQSFFILSFLFIPIVLEAVISNSIELLLNGIVVHLGNFGKMLRSYPVSVMIINNYNMNDFNIIFYFIFAIVLIMISSNVYIKRIPEKNDGYIRYTSLKSFYRFIFFVFFAMVSVIVAKDSLLILILCSFVNLVLCELILNNHLKINGGQKWYIFFICLLILIFSVLRFDLYKIEEKNIYVDEVDSIYIGTNYYNIDNLIGLADNEIVYDFENIDLREFENLTADKINKFINFHNKIMNIDNYESPYVYFAYKLKDEKIIIRKYRFDYKNLVNIVK